MEITQEIVQKLVAAAKSQCSADGCGARIAVYRDLVFETYWTEIYRRSPAGYDRPVLYIATPLNESEVRFLLETIVVRWPASDPKVEEELLVKQWKRYISLKRENRSGGRGRKRSGDRCPCGEYTKQLAAKRAHRCYAPVPGAVSGEDSVRSQAGLPLR